MMNLIVRELYRTVGSTVLKVAAYVGIGMFCFYSWKFIINILS